MTRCGIGPEFSIVSVLSGILAGWLTYLYSDRLTMLCIPYWFLAILVVPLIAYVSFKVSIHKEDNYLEEKFGQAYSDYRLRVNELFSTWRYWRDIT